MASIYFQTRKYDEEINLSFTVHDGSEPASLGSFWKGDEVVLLFDISKEMAEAVNRLGNQEFKAYFDYPDKGSVHIPFTVIERSHVCSWGGERVLRLVTESVTLQARTGYWEDLFLWICLGEVPSWAKESG